MSTEQLAVKSRGPSEPQWSPFLLSSLPALGFCRYKSAFFLQHRLGFLLGAELGFLRGE